MIKWFHRLEASRQKKIFKYLEGLDKLDCDDAEMIEAMIAKTKYNRDFCTECVEAYSDKQKQFTVQTGCEQEGLLF